MTDRYSPEHDRSLSFDDPAIVIDWLTSSADVTLSDKDRNAPYAGGHITASHGRPDEDIHALQLEIDRSLYLGPDLKTPGPGFDRVAGLIAAVAAALVAEALGPPFAVAADEFEVGGAGSSGSAVYSSDSRVVNLSGGGYCGWICATPSTFNPFNDAGDFQLALTYTPAQ